MFKAREQMGNKKKRDEIELTKKVKVKGRKTQGKPRFSYKTYPLLNTQALYVISMNDGRLVYQRNIEQLLGYEEHEFDYEKSLGYIHPDDYEVLKPILEGTIAYSAKFGVPDDNNFYISHRMRKKDGEYISVQQSNGVCKLAQNRTLKCWYTIIQDISFLRANIGVRWHWDNKELNLEEYKKFIGKSLHNILTKREIEVFELLRLGYNSDAIGKELSLSINTVNTHRKNMLKKTGAKSALEMIQLYE